MREIVQGFTEKTLEQVKAERIQESKEKLHSYLTAHPWMSDVKGGKTRPYTVTAEKQAMLTSELMLAQGAASAGTTSNAKWNSAGAECEVWDTAELARLAYEIAAYVKPYVSRQQTLEVLIDACETPEDVYAVAIDYTEV